MESHIHPSAAVGQNTEVGHCSIILDNVIIGKNCRIGHHVVIHADTVIGDDVRIDDQATIGKLPMKALNSATTQNIELPPAQIGNGSLIGTSAILYRGSRIAEHVLVADQATVREQSQVGAYTIIGRGVAIENRVTVGTRTKIEAGAYIASLSTIGDDCFVAPEVTVTNDNFMGRTEERKKHFKGITIQNGGRVGANATLLPGKTIESDGVVAAGALVSRDVPAKKIVAGVPATIFREVPSEQLIENQIVPENIKKNAPKKDTPKMNIPLLDLKAQFAGIQTDIQKAINEVLESQYFILGPTVENFEKTVADYVGTQHAIGVGSGTDALLLALMALDLGPGDEVITTPYSFFATAGVISRVGATPVFVDIDPITYNINPAQIEEKITSKTRAIIPVHLYGQAADMSAITQIAQKHDLKVIEDAAQALGASYPVQSDWRKVGSLGHLGCYSFFPSKNLGAYGDGGMIVTNDDALAEKLRILRVQGAKPKYHHSVVGCNSRLDAIQAAILNVKLQHLDTWSRKRSDNAEMYLEMLSEKCLIKREIIMPPRRVYPNGPTFSGDHVFNQFVIRLKPRNELQAFLKDRGIATEVYYPVPLHIQACYKDLGYTIGDMPEAERAANETLALPIYPELTHEQQQYVVDQIAVFFDGE
jgi:dTDP-4-amino-4,6-dideoxygalactose transaminase/acetyltransferase-like isoleucine patch superfamily enzyme